MLTLSRSFHYGMLPFLTLLLLLSQSLSEEAGRRKVERYLVIQGCKVTKPSEFFITLRDKLVDRITFQSVRCIASEKDELEAINSVMERKLALPDAEIHLVATKLQANHCEPGATCAIVNHGERYIPALRARVIGWFIENEPDFEYLGVNRTVEGIRSTELFPDNAGGGREVGEEFCRLAASIAPATIAVLYGAADASHSTARVQNFISGMNNYCPEAKHDVKYSFYADWSADKAAAIMSPIFLRDGSINAIFAANDDMALGALISARQMRPDKKLLVGGYDANAYTQPLLEAGDMFATVDQIPPSGLVYTLETLLSDKATGAGDFGAPTECSENRGPSCGLEDYNILQQAAWSNLFSSLPDKVSTAVTIRVKDPSVLVLRERLLLYNPKVAPVVTSSNVSARGDVVPPPNSTVPLPVLAQLNNFRIFEADAATSSVFGQGLLILSWTDARLAWSQVDFPETEFIRVDISTIWHPVVVLSNMLDSSFGRVETIQTTVFADGSVVWEQNINSAEYRCATMDDTLLHFPFDVHNCGVDLSSYNTEEFTLQPTAEMPPSVVFEARITNNDWEQGPTSVELETEASKFEVVHFRVGMARDPTFVILAMVIPSFLLNIISFAQFWIPAQAETINLDRGGMAITTILASLALRQSTVSEVDTAFTFLDVFLMLSLTFHFIGFLITAYESSFQQIKRRTEMQLGIGDKMGKLVLPIVFGVLNIALAVIWAKGVWALFYLSLIEVVGCILVNRKTRARVAKSLSDLSGGNSLRARLGFMRKGSDEEMGETPESIVRYMKWRKVMTSERKLRDDTWSTTGESRIGLGSVPEDEAAAKLQRFFRSKRELNVDEAH